MPQIACDRINPNLVVPHLIIRQPLPSGTSILTEERLDQYDESTVQPLALAIAQIQLWITATDITLINIAASIAALEADSISIRGLMIPWPSTAIPDGWLLCDGSSQLKASYPALYDLLRTPFGGDDTHFNLPDLRGKFIRGYNSVGVFGAAFTDTTGRPASLTDIPTSDSSSLSHKHTITAGAGDGKLHESVAHRHTITVNDKDLPDHSHGSVGSGAPGYGTTEVAGSHAHAGNTGYVAPHDHDIGASGAPVSAFEDSALPTKIAYDAYYDTLAWDPGAGGGPPTRRTYFLTLPNIYTGADIWKTGMDVASPGHRHTIPTQASHFHALGPENVSLTHNHVATSDDQGIHTHSGETALAAPTNHAHTVSKTTGWDSETVPPGLTLNVIIRI